MITWIGLCAGEVWRYLDAHKGHAKLKDLISGIDAPRETVIMAVGWLARGMRAQMRNLWGESPPFPMAYSGN